MDITKYLEDITDFLYKKENINNVGMIISPTGTGKSVGIPLAIASTGGKMFISVPTRIAAISLYKYVSSIVREGELDIKVGYAAEGEIKYSRDDNIVYATSGHLRKKLLKYTHIKSKKVNFTDFLVIDEFHTGSIDNTINQSLWAYFYKHNYRVPKLVFMSATPISVDLPVNIDRFTVESKSNPVEIIYSKSDYYKNEKILYEEIGKLALDIHKRRLRDDNYGAMLIFAPGLKEIEKIVSYIESITRKKYRKSMILLPIHSTSSPEELSKIDENFEEEKKRKIVIGTNIAEAAITISGVIDVISSMLEKRQEASESHAIRLVTHSIARDSAQQQSGRAGRDRTGGKCYRMITKESYDLLEDHKPKEVDRIPIYAPIMELLSENLVPSEILQGVSIDKIISTVSELESMNLIDKQNRPTNMGSFVVNFNLSLKSSIILYNNLRVPNFIFPVIVVLSLIDAYGGPYFFFPYRDINKEEYKEDNFGKYIGDNDLITICNVYVTYLNSIHIKDFDNKRKIGKWALDNSMNGKRLKEAVNFMTDAIDTLYRLRGITVTIGRFNPINAVNLLRDSFYSLYPKLDRLRGNSFKLEKGSTRYIYDSSWSLIDYNDIEQIYSIVEVQIKKGERITNIVSLALDVPKEESYSSSEEDILNIEN
jgi:HrpA-like RNA helicase